jgi:hypothetical protein
VVAELGAKSEALAMKPIPSLLVFTLIVGTSLAIGQRTRTVTPPTNTDPAAVNLVKQCQSTVGDYFSLCAGYLSGIAFGIDATSSRREMREICFPVFPLPLITNIEVFTKYVERNPDKLNQHLGYVAYAAYLEAYPCKK